MEQNNKNNVDNSHWKLGIFYYNKDDKRIFPPKKRKYLGWTINFANPYSIIAMIILFILVYCISKYIIN
jgi:uncharacterized membrane protein